MTNTATGQHYAWRGIGLAALLLSATSSVAENSPVQPAEMAFVQIQTGCFLMGASQVAPISEQGQPIGPRLDELPQHKVCVDAFELASHEVTRAQWQQIMGGEPVTPEKAQLPKGYVTWADAQHFIARLNQNQTAAATRYRLPTEAEWEYACRAGVPASPNPQLDTPEHLAQLQTIAWFNRPIRTDPQAHPVGQLPANAWGLHDMLGNVWEWTADVYQADGYRMHQPSNPRVDQGDDKRAIRGASYSSDRFLVRCGSRNYGIPDDPLPTQGLRLVRQPATN